MKYRRGVTILTHGSFIAWWTQTDIVANTLTTILTAQRTMTLRRL
mgnify:CR=1 FL=1